LRRLIGSGRSGMGALFKVLGVSHPGIGSLPGFGAVAPDAAVDSDDAAEAAQ
jgi:hypothetical protein